MTTRPPQLELTQEAQQRNGSGRRLERAAIADKLTRIRRGAYVEAAEWSSLTPDEQHLGRIEATRRAARKEPVFSHESAAVIHGIPLLSAPPKLPHTTVAHGRAKTNGAVTRTHQELSNRDIVTLEGGLRVTSLVRTVIDLAALGTPLGARIAVDHVRRHRSVTVDELRETLDAVGRIRGVRQARLAIDRSSAQCDSPLETLVLVRCRDLGFARPAQQVEIQGNNGRTYRADFGWLDGRILLEADGRTKYRDPEMLAGREADEIVWQEKRREDAIRGTCDAFARVSWKDAWHGRGLEQQLIAIGVPRPRRRAATLTF